MDSEIFINEKPITIFMKCAVPAMLSSVFGALYSVIDGVFVGKYLGEDALAAINLVTPVMFIVSAFSSMIATGASVNISILLGEKNREDASRIFSFSLKFIGIFSVVIGVLGWLFADRFVAVIAPGATEDALIASAQYLKVFSLFAPLLTVYFAIDNYLRVCGKQNLSMIICVVSQLLNVILDFLFIAVLKLGIVSAAVASCVSIAVCSVYALLCFRSRRLDIYYTLKGIPIHRFLRILANGSSEFFSSISMSIMSIVMNLFLLKYGGTTAIAAFSIVMYVDSIVGMLNFGICDSLQPAISYCYGAGVIDRMKSIFRLVLLSSVIISLISFLFMFFAGPKIAFLFTSPDDIELLEMSKTAIKIFAFSYLFGWIDMCYSSYFTSLDCPFRSFSVSFLGTLVFPIAFLFILTDLYGLNGVWMMSAVASVASGIFTLILAKTLKLKPAPVLN